MESCRLAAANNDYQSLIIHAESVLAKDQTCTKAWNHLIVGLFALRKWAALDSAISSAIRVPSVSKQRHYHLSHISRAASIARRLSASENQTATELLHNSWYKNRLTHLVESNSLAKAVRGSERCVIIDTPGNRGNDQSHDCMHFTDGCRSIGKGELLGFPLDQAANRRIYLKHRTLQLSYRDELTDEEDYEEDNVDYFDENYEDYGQPTPKFLFPCFRLTVPPETEIFGGNELGVHVLRNALPVEVRNLLRNELEKLSIARPDSPAPSYVNIIDPNVGVHNGFWVPIDVRVEETSPAEILAPLTLSGRKANRGMFPSSALSLIYTMSGSPKHAKCKIESAIPDLDPHRYALLHTGIEAVLDAALPLLASLRNPALLLPGPLQVVVKAQRIVLEANQEYVGVWHDDGLNENVVAVILYYYRVSESLQGGGLEFASKSGVEVGCGDYGGDYNVGKGMDGAALRKAVCDLPRCIVEVNEGTMVVFNNYPMVHRVLRMVAEESGGSRDFVALFVIDQKHPLERPETLVPRKERLAKRHELLVEQLKPRGHFGFDDSEVTCCGNGAHSDLKWIRSAYQYPLTVFPKFGPAPYRIDVQGAEFASWLNMEPPEIKRGASYLTSLGLPRIEYNPESTVEAHVVRGDNGEDVIFVVDYATRRFVRASEADCFKEKGLRTVRLFKSKGEWNEAKFEFGLWAKPTDEYYS